MGVVRAEVVQRMRSAIKAGLSASKFISKMREAGLSYRRTDMLADWRDAGSIQKKEGLARYVRKGYVPSDRIAEIRAWSMSKEYMYKVRSESILRAGEKPVTRFVNIMSDRPMTIEEIEEEIWERSFTQSPPKAGEERKFIVDTVIHRSLE